jgi:coniferyl-aldehyde dehydrogenase
MADLLGRQRKAFAEQGAPSAEARIQSLNRLIASVIAHESKIVEALAADFGHRSPDATRWTDVAAIIEGVKHCRKNVRKWMKPERRSPAFPLGLMGARAEVRYQPLGVVGIVSPWNFPVYLAFSPLAGVLAAGNRAIIRGTSRGGITAKPARSSAARMK